MSTRASLSRCAANNPPNPVPTMTTRGRPPYVGAGAGTCAADDVMGLIFLLGVALHLLQRTAVAGTELFPYPPVSPLTRPGSGTRCPRRRPAWSSCLVW